MFLTLVTGCAWTLAALDREAPGLTLDMEPTAGPVNGTLQIHARLDDAETGLTSISLRIDGEIWHEAPLSGEIWEGQWDLDTTAMTDGTHEIVGSTTRQAIA